MVQEIVDLGESLKEPQAIAGLDHLEVVRGEPLPEGPRSEPAPRDMPPEEPPGTLLRCTREARRANAGGDVFRFSALGESAAISVREAAVNPYFCRELPSRLAVSSGVEQEELGTFFANYMIPEDFRRLIEVGDHLTLVVDDSTAHYPWEMAILKGRRTARCFGTDLRLSRQFQTLLSAVPGVAPPLNNELNVLIIADPAGGAYALDGARKEGLAVVEALRKAWEDWQRAFQLHVTVRIGAYSERDSLADQLDEVRKSLGPLAASVGKGDPEPVRACDPLELVTLLVNHAYDVVHFAGHGVFDPKRGRMGWVFDNDCILSASEIFRVRQVPRLVFANACHSTVTTRAEQQRQQVGLAQAFFARGIQNYVGTGWKVDDGLAKEFAVRFYREVVSARTAPPATISYALRAARTAIRRPDSTTWGAYQHYGDANDKLLARPNLNLSED